MADLVRLAAGALLLSEKRTIRELRMDVSDATLRAAGEVTQSHNLRDATLLMLLLHQSERLKFDLERTLRKAKKRAREAAARRLQVELRAVGAMEAAERVSLISHIATDIRAATTAESVALAWRQRAIHDALKASRTDASVAEAIGDVDIDSNVTRAGATESAQAYDEGHVEAAEAAVAAGADLEGLVDRWEALLDACPRCSSLDGDTTPVGEPFANGEEPSQVHPRCRCMRVTQKAP